MVIYNTPHVLVLANEPPLMNQWSDDRLRVWDLDQMIEDEEKEWQATRDKIVADGIRSYGPGLDEGSLPPALIGRSLALQEPALQELIRVSKKLVDANSQAEKKRRQDQADCPPWFGFDLPYDDSHEDYDPMENH